VRSSNDGWRRKAGLVTLAVAMLLTADWMRSSVDKESIDLVSSEAMTVRKLTSDEGHIGLELSSNAMDADWIATKLFRYEHTSYWIEYLKRPQRDFAWRWQCLGLSIGKTRYFLADRCFVVVPYGRSSCR
jgi:hypothetical protein